VIAKSVRETSGGYPLFRKAIDKSPFMSILIERLKEGDSLEGLPPRRSMAQGKIHIPPALIEAQESNDLIVFAGAGVSYARPTRCRTLLEVLKMAWEKHAPTDWKEFDDLDDPESRIFKLFDSLVKQRGNVVKQYVQSLYSEYVQPSLIFPR